MPSDAELRELASIVCERYPFLTDITGPAFYGARVERLQDWHRQFVAAFRALGAMKRTPQVDRKRYASHWIDEAEMLLRSLGKSTTLRFGPFTAALLAHGDIPYAGLFMDGCVPEFGLSLYVGREASDAWRGVLASGKLLAPSPTRQIMAAPSPARVVEY